MLLHFLLCCLNFCFVLLHLTENHSVTMFLFVSFQDWIHQAIHIFLLKFISWYDFIFTHMATCTTTDSEIPNEIVKDILLRLPPKSLFKCTFFSKSRHQIISSPNFVNTHYKLNDCVSRHEWIFQLDFSPPFNFSNEFYHFNIFRSGYCQ